MMPSIHNIVASRSCRASASESIESSMGYRQKILDQIDDPSVKKILIMRWWEWREIAPSQAELLIRSNALEAA